MSVFYCYGMITTDRDCSASFRSLQDPPDLHELQDLHDLHDPGEPGLLQIVPQPARPFLYFKTETFFHPFSYNIFYTCSKTTSFPSVTPFSNSKYSWQFSPVILVPLITMFLKTILPYFTLLTLANPTGDL